VEVEAVFKDAGLVSRLLKDTDTSGAKADVVGCLVHRIHQRIYPHELVQKLNLVRRFILIHKWPYSPADEVVKALDQVSAFLAHIPKIKE